MHWQSERGHSIKDTIREMGGKIDRRLEAVFGQDCEDRLVRMAKEVEKGDMPEDLERLVDRRGWYDLIPD